MSQPGAPYGSPNGTPPPQGYGPPGGFQQRPKGAKAAATLGIVSGSLGIASAVLTIALNRAFQSELDKLQGRARADLLAQAMNLVNMTYVLAVAMIVVGALLLVSGIQFRSSKGYTLLTAGAIAQIVIVVADLLLALSASGLLNTPPNAGTFLRVAAGLGLAIATLTNLSKSETKRWKDSVS